jgi:hypothetical protein
VKRALRAVVSAALLMMTVVPGTVSADRVTKFEDRHVGAFCESPFDGGFVSANLGQSAEFGTSASIEVWLASALPFEDPASLSGFTDELEVTESPDDVVFSATIPVFDSEGDELGDASIVATLVPDGEPEIVVDEDFGNRNSHTTGFIQPLAGTASISIPGATFEVECFGAVSEVSVHDTNPHAFTANNEGVLIECSWEVDGGFAYFFAVDDAFGFFADAGLFTASLELFQAGAPSGSIDANGVTASIVLGDGLTGDPYSAEAAADFTPIGDPTTSFLKSQSGRIKVVEQRLSVEGSLAFSTGDVFTLDDEACFANTFDSHSIRANPSGPKPGPAPVNDSPEGAIELSPGDRVQVNTSGAALDPEVPITTCAQGPFDDMGHTVWYTVEGTGDMITVDTAGSHFDTVMAVYVMDGGDLVEIACVDDVFLDPIGSTFQAAISGPTEQGETYWIQVGGFREFFSPEEAESGRLKLSVH